MFFPIVSVINHFSDDGPSSRIYFSHLNYIEKSLSSTYSLICCTLEHLLYAVSTVLGAEDRKVSRMGLVLVLEEFTGWWHPSMTHFAEHRWTNFANILVESLLYPVQMLCMAYWKNNQAHRKQNSSIFLKLCNLSSTCFSNINIHYSLNKASGWTWLTESPPQDTLHSLLFALVLLFLCLEDPRSNVTFSNWDTEKSPLFPLFLNIWSI